ncbi:hypothetical protein RO3G_06639 [Rhizopus delemar RA 99-880]|uniref:VPS37 C-terminal domain-containing protein n=1 Tax=Rhizopus delemar (strain RA 99-880 / ATCC MYA-4621 / FGSC 9543 / NRRL 43880) TaxID=246409 RepID=I1C0F4_RHIO9|nr:hypothetical protein RO3G_06639 [Rhizopus delemar RA 99-880]|eukprot:EIE81934.1 hypothetical protein RO3G_06639 [Rhizopus delemar RA 99-880]
MVIVLLHLFLQLQIQNMLQFQEEVEELLYNETAFDLYFQNMERVKNLKAFQEELRNGNEILARKL